MIRPKKLTEFLEKSSKQFQELNHIFISNQNGQLIACTNQNNQLNNLSYSLCNLWKDYFEIGNLKLGSEINQIDLHFAILEHQNGNIIITTISDQFLFGVDIKKNENIGIQFRKMQKIKNYLQSHLSNVFEDE